MSSKGDPRKTARYQRSRARVLASRPPCALCGQEIDWDAPPRTRWAPSADHEIPVALGGAWGRLRAAHFGCNARRGDGTRNTEPVPPMPQSRRW